MIDWLLVPALFVPAVAWLWWRHWVELGRRERAEAARRQAEVEAGEWPQYPPNDPR